MKGVLSGLVYWACRAGTRDFCSALAALVDPVQNVFYAPCTALIQFLCPHCPVSWVGSPSGSPVSYYVSLVVVETESDKGVREIYDKKYS